MENAQKITLRQSRSFSEIINETFAFIKQNFKKLGKSILFIVGPLALITGVFSGLVQIEMYPFPTGEGLANWFSYYLLSIALTVVTAVFLAGVVYEYMLLYNNRQPDEFDVDEIWKATIRDFWKLFLALILFMGVVLLGFMLCLVPGIFFMVAFSLTMVTIVVEKSGILQAMSRSFELISGHWWFTLGLVLIMALIQGMLTFVFYIPEFTLMLLSDLHSAGESQLSSNLRIGLFFTSILSSVGYYFLEAIPAIALGFHYFNLVERKEAAGLMKRIDQIGGTRS